MWQKLIKLLKIQDNIKLIFLIGILCIFIILVSIFLFSSKKHPEEITSNPENVISPIPNQDNGYEISSSIADYSEYFNKMSDIPYSKLENYLYNWQILLDIFMANKINLRLNYAISRPELENLTSIVQNTQREFYKGSSDEILSEYGKLIKEQCSYYKLDWRLIISIIKQESDFTSNAVSRAGAYGFMQIMPQTGSTLEKELNLEEHITPTNNLIAGIYYYALLVARYDEAGDTNKYELALAAYNCGSGHVEDAMTIVFNQKPDRNEKYYLKWTNVSEALKELGPNYDTLHLKIWGAKPPNGSFTNWQEPVNYVFNIMYYWGEYKKIYPLPDDHPKRVKKHKKK